MYPIAVTVQACLQAGTQAEVAWTVATRGLGPRPAAEAIVFTPGGGRVGAVLDGALDERVAEQARLVGNGPGRLLELEIGHVEALVSGLEPGGVVQVIVTSAAALPADLWPALVARRPVAIVATISDRELTDTRFFTDDDIAGADAAVAAAFASSASVTQLLDDGRIVTVLRPQPRLVLAGGGDYPDAIGELATWLGWQVERVTDPVTASALAAALGPGDAAIVGGHEHELTGTTLQAALGSDAGYVGALGAPRVRRQREHWLSERGTTDLSRLHTPAGLDIGSREPREVALSVLAELYTAVRHSTGLPLELAAIASRTERGEQPAHRCS